MSTTLSRLPALSSLRAAALAVVALLATAPACATDDVTDLTEDAAEAGVRPTFDLWETEGRHYFHLVAANGETLLSSQAYQTRSAALTGLLAVLDNGGLPARYVVKPGADGKFYVSLEAANRRTIATAEGYASRANAERAITTMVNNVAAYLAYWDTARGARFQVSAGATGAYSFNLYAANGAVLLSSESYTTEAAALNGAFSVADNGVAAARYQVKAAANGKHYFNLTATNGQVIGTSQLYATRASAERGRDATIALLASGSVELL